MSENLDVDQLKINTQNLSNNILVQILYVGQYI
jgi:hypothetical protein